MAQLLGKLEAGQELAGWLLMAPSSLALLALHRASTKRYLIWEVMPMCGGEIGRGDNNQASQRYDVTERTVPSAMPYLFRCVQRDLLNDVGWVGVLPRPDI